jgi:hypothetical protein
MWEFLTSSDFLVGLVYLAMAAILGTAIGLVLLITVFWNRAGDEENES